MKIQKYLNMVKYMVMNEPDIDLKTYKRMLEFFKVSLNEKYELPRWNSELKLLLQVNNTQLSLKSAYELALAKGILNHKKGD